LRLESLGTDASNVPIVLASDDGDDDRWGWDVDSQRKTSTQWNTSPSAALSNM